MARSATQCDHAGVDEQFRDLGDPPDVLDPRLIGEAEIAVDAVAKLVAVKQRGMAAEIAKALVHQIAIEDLPAPASTGRWSARLIATTVSSAASF